MPETPVPDWYPIIMAWKVYRETEAYRNTCQWALNPNHVDGPLWAAFEAGYRAGAVDCLRAKSAEEGKPNALSQKW